MKENFGVRRFNFSDYGVSKKINISSDAVPTLIPKDILNKWQEGDSDPYYKLQMIEYPIVANRLVYEESFFESYLGKLNDRPIPGSKSGHTTDWGARGSTDFILVGGKVEKNGDGTGRVFFKNYIPPVGELGSNEIFIKENKSDMIHFSLVSYVKEIRENDGDETKIRIIESIGGERNDAVGHGCGAMDQVTNAENDIKVDDTVFNSVCEKIKNGCVDKLSSWIEDEKATHEILCDDKGDKYFPVVKNGKVFRSALRKMEAFAAQNDLPEIKQKANELLDLMHKKINKGNTMDKNELLEAARVLCSNGQVTLVDVANSMGLQSQVVTTEHLEALKIVNALKAEKIIDPMAEINALRKNILDNTEAVRNAKLTEVFGTRGTDENPNLLRSYADGKTENLSGEKLMNAIEELKKDPIALKFQAEKADINSQINTIGRVENKSNSASGNSVVVDY